MTTHVEIVAEFDDRSVMVSANDLKRKVEQTGDDTGEAWSQGFVRGADGRLRDERGRFVKIGQDLGGDLGKGMSDGFGKELPKFKAGLADAANATRAFHDEQKRLQDLMRSGAGWDDVIRQSERTATAHKFLRDSARDAGAAFGEFEDAQKALSSGAEGAASSLTNLGGVISKLSGPAMAAGIVELGAVVVELGGVAASAAQSLWLVPAAASAAGAAVGTVALATFGFGDALKAVGDPKKFGEALQQLSPNAQQAALSIQALMPAFTELRKATSDAFFANVGPQLNQLTNQFLPTIQSLTTGIAGAFNQAFSGITAQLMTPGTQQAIQQLTGNIAAAFQALAPAAAPFVKALTDIAAVGSGSLPGLAQGIANAANAFSQFITEARATGDLKKWLDEGLTTLGQLGQGAWALAEAFMALAPTGQSVLPDIVDALKGIKDIMPAIGLAALLLGPAFGPLELGAKGAKAAADLMSAAFEAIKPVVQSVGNAVIPVFNSIGKAASDMLAPIRAAAGLIGINIPEFQPIAQISFGSTGNGTPGVNRTSLGGSTLPTAGIDPFTGLPVPSAARAAGGGIGSAFNPGQTWQSTRGPGNTIGGSGLSAGGGAGGAAGLPQAPALPYDTSLPAGYGNLPQTAEIVGAENSFMDARHAVAEKQARVAQLEKDTTATEADRVKANNDVINAKQQQQQAELRLQDAAANLYKKSNQQLDGYASQMGEIGAKLDQDLGISKGLPGLADNLVRFLGNLIAAPELAKLNALTNAPGQAQGGFGLMGVLGAQGAFGPQYTAAGQAAAAASSGQPSPSVMGPAGLQPIVGLTGPAQALVGPGGSGTSPNGFTLNASEQGFSVNGVSSQGAAGGPAARLQQFAQWFNDNIEPVKELAGYDAGGHGLGNRSNHTSGTALDINWGDFTALQGNGADARTHFNPAQMQAISQELEQMGMTWGQYWTPGSRDPGHFELAGAPYSRKGPQNVDAMAGQPAGGSGNIAASTGSITGGATGLPMPMPVTIVGGLGAGGAVPVAVGAPGATPGGGGAPGGAVAGSTGDPYSPANTNPALNNPPAPGGGGGGPGMGYPQGAPLGGAPLGPMNFGGPGAGPTQIGANVSPAAGSGSGGIGITPGGSIDTAMSLAASAFPGVGQAAQTGAKLASRAIQFGGQAAAIGVQGLMDTVLPTGGSELANHSWFSKILGGLAGAAPALPNMAGKAAAATGKDKQGQQGPPQAGGDTHINVTEDPNRGADGTGRDIAWHQQQAQLPPGKP